MLTNYRKARKTDWSSHFWPDLDSFEKVELHVIPAESRFSHNTARKQSEREERTGKRVEMARKAMDGEAEHSAWERLPVGRHVGQM